jgi:hypothetical protein
MSENNDKKVESLMKIIDMQYNGKTQTPSRQWIKDNWEEFTWGAILGLGFFVFIAWSCLWLSLCCGILWRLGGSGLWPGKVYRRIGIPVLLAVVIPLPLLSRLIAGIATFGLTTIGYGHIDRNDDTGSPFGNWCWKMSGENEVVSLIMSRGLIICGIWAVWLIAWRFQ